MEPGSSVAGLTNWLDRELLPHDDLTRTESTLFIHRVLTGLMESRGWTIEQLAGQKFRLRTAIAEKIDQHRAAAAAKGFQRALFSAEAKEIEVSPELCFEITQDQYSAHRFYEGEYGSLPKHYFPLIGAFDSKDEFDCAFYLANLDTVQYWLRNLVRSESSFRLQTSSDKFYPDFVALLTDGRYLVVEYKNETDWSNDDSKEKRTVGNLWADRSKGQCLFVMPKGKEWAEIAEKARCKPTKTRP